MAHHLSAMKSVRKTARQTFVNRGRISSMRTLVKKVKIACDAKNQEEATKLFVAATKKIMSNVRKGVVHKNTAARKVSRLNAFIKRTFVK